MILEGLGGFRCAIYRVPSTECVEYYFLRHVVDDGVLGVFRFLNGPWTLDSSFSTGYSGNMPGILCP